MTVRVRMGSSWVGGRLSGAPRPSAAFLTGSKKIAGEGAGAPLSTAAVLCVFVISTLLSSGCRTAAPDGQPVAPLQTSSAEEAMRELVKRRESFRGARSLMRVRASVKGQTRSFRAQLEVSDPANGRLTVYTPIGTTAMAVVGEGETVTLEGPGQRMVGNADDLASSIGLFAGNLTFAQLGLLILGLPPRDDLIFETTPAGLQRAVAGDLTASFEPPVYPPTRVVLTRGPDRVEIDHEEIVSE